MGAKPNGKSKINGSYQKFAESLHDVVAEAVTESVRPIKSEIEMVKKRLDEHHLGIVNLTESVRPIKSEIEMVKKRLDEHHLGIVNLTDAVNEIGKRVKP